MNCRSAQKLLVDRAAGILPEDAVAPLEEHLHTCPSCRAAAESAREAEEALRALRVPDPPPGYWEGAVKRIESGLREARLHPAAPVPASRGWLLPLAGAAALALVAAAAVVWEVQHRIGPAHRPQVRTPPAPRLPGSSPSGDVVGAAERLVDLAAARNREQTVFAMVSVAGDKAIEILDVAGDAEEKELVSLVQSYCRIVNEGILRPLAADPGNGDLERARALWKEAARDHAQVFEVTLRKVDPEQRKVFLEAIGLCKGSAQ